MRSRLQAESMGFQMTAEAKEAQRQREAAEEEKLRRLLKYQQEGQKEEEEIETAREEADGSGDEEFNPNLIPLGGIGVSGASPEREGGKNEELIKVRRTKLFVV